MNGNRAANVRPNSTDEALPICEPTLNRWWQFPVTVLFGKEGGEARDGMSNGFGAGKSSACVL